MKLLIILLLLSLVGVVGAQPYVVYTIVNDENGNPELNVPVTFSFENESKTLYTVDDGSVVFSTFNFKTTNGSVINIETKYGMKNITIDYTYSGSGVIYNEKENGIKIFAILGFAAISIGGGIYYLKRRFK